MACGEGKLMTNLNILALKKAQLVSDVLDLKKPQFLLTMLISNISYFKKATLYRFCKSLIKEKIT